MIVPQTLQSLKDILAEQQGNGSVTLEALGQMLGNAIKRKPYSRSYVHHLLKGKKPITAQIDRAARILMLKTAAMSERPLTDPMPIFGNAPIEKLKAGQAAGVNWQELYVADADVRQFVDTLVGIIVRG